MKYVLVAVTAFLLSGCVEKNVVPQKEPIPSLDYQHCLDARHEGGGEGISKECGQLQHDIEQTSN